MGRQHITKGKCYGRKAREDGKSTKYQIMSMKGESAVLKSVIEENNWELRSEQRPQGEEGISSEGQYVRTEPSAIVNNWV